MKKNKALLCIHQGWDLYGSDRSFLLNLQLFNKILGKSHKLDVIIPRSGIIVNELNKITANIHFEEIGKVERQEAKSKPFKSLLKILKSSPQCYRRMKEADIVYINTIVPFGYLFGAFFFRKKVILHVREIPSKSAAIIFKYWFLLCRINVIFNSENTRDAFNMFRYKRGHVLLNAVEPIQIKSIKEGEHSLINLLLLGRINAWKGQDFFVDSFSKLDKSYQDKFRIRIVGDTPIGQEFYKERLIQQIDDLRLAEKVELFPFTDDPLHHFNWADIVVVPSTLPEPFGRVAVESFSAKTPVIASKHGGLKETVNNQNGWHFEPSEDNQLRIILKNIADDPSQILKKGEVALSDFNKYYSIEIYEQKFNSYINDFLNRL